MIVGFICAVLVKPVHSKHYMSAEALAANQAALNEKIAKAQASGDFKVTKPTSAARLTVTWLIVGIPLAYGIWQTVLQTVHMFK